MKHSLLVASAIPLLASCSDWDALISRNITSSDLPGIPTQISCDPAPTLIYSKTGQLIDTIIPVLHPSCEEDGAVLSGGVTTGGPWWSKFGPPTYKPLVTRNAATDDDYVPPRAASANPSEPPAVANPSPTSPAEGGEPPAEPAAPSEPQTPETPVEAGGCSDSDSCHDHPDHDPARNDNSYERVHIHGMSE